MRREADSLSPENRSCRGPASPALAARAYGRIYAEVAAQGRKARGRRALDLLIASTALAVDVPLYKRKPENFRGLDDLLEIRSLKDGDAS